ncbi:MAG: GDP-mannose 4,6-dehydratase [Chloroflexota bacterium]
MNVLLTGATGFIGQHLVEKLLSDGETVVTLLLREAYSHTDISPLPATLAKYRKQFNVVYADLRNFQLTSRALREAQPDAVIHLAAAGVSDPFLGVETAVRHNLTGTVNLLRACFETNHSVKKIVVSRTPGELTHLNVYATSKLAAWNFCQMYVRTHQWPIIGAMIFQAFGHGQTTRSLVPSAIKAALSHQDFPMTEGKQAKDWIYISDVVDGLLATLHADIPAGTTIDLGSGQPTAVFEIVQKIYAISQSNGQPLIGAIPSRPGEVQIQQADSTRTEALTGWKTAVSLEQGLSQTIQNISVPKSLN